MELFEGLFLDKIREGTGIASAQPRNDEGGGVKEGSPLRGFPLHYPLLK
ncbi:hypothetical protein DGWBC_1658 [Dehalogenimonas sp. WBC-2]|nr:hypothetical protein DGWBC_1658 [Dehalogenimonas sp. WBC-2]